MDPLGDAHLVEKVRLAGENNHDASLLIGMPRCAELVVHSTVALWRLIEVLHANTAAVEDGRIDVLAIVRVLLNMDTIHVIIIIACNAGTALTSRRRRVPIIHRAQHFELFNLHPRQVLYQIFGILRRCWPVFVPTY